MTKNEFRKLALKHGFSVHYSGKQKSFYLIFNNDSDVQLQWFEDELPKNLQYSYNFIAVN